LWNPSFLEREAFVAHPRLAKQYEDGTPDQTYDRYPNKPVIRKEARMASKNVDGVYKESG